MDLRNQVLGSEDPYLGWRNNSLGLGLVGVERDLDDAFRAVHVLRFRNLVGGLLRRALALDLNTLAYAAVLGDDRPHTEQCREQSGREKRSLSNHGNRAARVYPGLAVGTDR